MNKNNMTFGAIIMVALMLMVSLTVAVEQQSLTENTEKMYGTITMEKINFIKTNPNVEKLSTLAEPLGMGIHPAVSSDGTDMVFAFESTDEENVVFGGYSTATNEWIAAGGWENIYPPESPDVDSCGSGRYIGSYVPNYLDNTGVVNIVEISDIYDTGTWLAGYLDLSTYGFENIVDIAVGGYTPEDQEERLYNFGGYSFITDYYDSETGEFYESTISYTYPNPEESYVFGSGAYFGERGITGCTSVSMDIDPVTFESYAAYTYDNNGNMEIFVIQENFGEWEDLGGGFLVHPSIRTKTIRSAGNDNYVDVAALNDKAIIVSERDESVVAYYSTNGGFSYSESVVSPSGYKPRVTYLDDSIATCQFTKDDGVYYSITLNDGETWTTPEKIPDTDGASTTEQSADICKLGSVYETVGEIYYEQINFEVPILEINSVSGGIGVSVEIGNVGNGDASEKEYEVAITGGQFDLIDKQITGTLSIPAGSTKSIDTGIIFGLGPINIDIKVGTLRQTVTGKQLLIFTQLEE